MIQPPPPEIIERYPTPVLAFLTLLVSAASKVMQERGTLALAPTSWYRTPGHNAEVGGNADSQHLIGAALDVAGLHAIAFGEAWRSLGGVAVNEGDHVHVQVYPRGVGPRLV